MAIKKELSLLPDTENPNSLSARVFKWLTTVGRWVIIITELVVVIAFLSRFWLDRKNSDLSEVSRQEQSILNSTQEFENEFSSFQQRLVVIKNFYNQQPQYDQQINTLITSTPQDIVFDNLSINYDSSTNQTKANASLTAFKEDSIVSFITNLMVNPDIQSVNINQIEKKPKENNYSISISVVFKDSKTKT